MHGFLFFHSKRIGTGYTVRRQKKAATGKTRKPRVRIVVSKLCKTNDDAGMGRDDRVEGQGDGEEEVQERIWKTCIIVIEQIDKETVL